MQGRACVMQDTALHGYVASVDVRYEVERVHDGLEIRAVYVVAAGAVDDASNLHPDGRHGTHARL